MASYPSQESRPLKRARFGSLGPDVYPQEPKQKEDDLSHTNVKHGFQQQPFDDEYKTAKEKLHDLSEEKINKFFSAVLAEKTKLNTIADPGKRKLGHNIRDIFWHVTQGSKVEPWLKDLAGTKPLKTLAKKVPIFNKKDDIFKNLSDYNVPMKRAVWFIKMTNSYHAALAEARVRNRGKQLDAYTEWAQVTKDFLKYHLQKIIDYYQGNGVQSLTVASTIDQSTKYWNYGTQLAKHLYERGLLDRDAFLTFLLDQLEKQKITDDTVLKLVLGQILRYLSEFVQSQLLGRKLAYFCCKKIATLTQESGCSSPRTQSPTLTTQASNGAVQTSSGNGRISPQNPLISVFKEYNSCPQHRPLILSLSAIIQVVLLRCPGALIWHNHGEGKMVGSALSGSPLDLLPCSPSCLPMPPGMDNPGLRAQLRRCEDQVRLRSRMSEARWSSDKCQQSAKGFTISKILQVLDKLDRQNFGKLEVNNFLECLYSEVFGVLQCKENEPAISDEPIVNLLCEWAVSTQRTGQYRARIVAKLLEKRQVQVNAEKYGDDDMDTDTDSDIAGNGGLPVFQTLLLSFLDNKAPYLEDTPSAENKQAFCNLIHLFSELINHDVFSHDAYMCTLISRGDLADAPTLRQGGGGGGSGGRGRGGGGGAGVADITELSSVRSELPRHEDNRMELDHPHLDSDFDIFAFKDEAKSSPGMPASVKSIGPFSVPTPGHPQTPMSQMSQTPGRTPGGPTTPLGMGGARTPGAPHTPGAHTPGKATTPLGAGGMTQGMAHTPGLTPGGPTTPSRTPVHAGGPHTPGIVAYLSGGGHHSGMSSHTPHHMSASQSHHSHGAGAGGGSGAQGQTGEPDSALRAKKHLCYAMHFPIPQDEYGNHENNQRIVMLYGVGKARDEARHIVKKTTKEILKLFGKKNCIDVCSGEVKKKEKKKDKVAGTPGAPPSAPPPGSVGAVGSVGPPTAATPGGPAPAMAVNSGADKAETDSLANYESTQSKFQRLSFHDQHALTQQCSTQVLESIQSFSSGASQHLPLIENITFLCDLMEQCYNVSVLVEFLVELLKELPEVDTQLGKKKSNLEGSYYSSLCLCVVSVLRKYHAYLLLSNQLTCSVFESLCNIVKHVGNPADCTSAERCILAYLYDLFTTSFHVKTKFQELFSGASAKVKAALFAQVAPVASNHVWDPAYMIDLIDNPKVRVDAGIVKQILEAPSRYSFVCNVIQNVCNTQSVDRLNELGIMSAELTSQCNALSCEWLGVLKALCCSSSNPSGQTNLEKGGWSKNYGFMDILFQIELNDYAIHDSLAIFTALLVARHSFSIENIIIHVALPSLLGHLVKASLSDIVQSCKGMARHSFSIENIIIHVALPSLLGHPGPPADSAAEQGARLTCHLLLRLFQTAHINPNTRPESRKHLMSIKSSTDRHLLDAQHEACEIGAIVAVLKALIMLSDSIGATVKKNNSESNGDIIQTMLKSLEDDEDDDDLDMGLTLPGITPKSKGVEQAGLSEYARHVLKEICSQDWVREKFLKDPEALLTSDLLLDNILSHKQAQQLVQLICYPEGVPSLPPIDDDDNDISEQKRNISRIVHNMDQWKLRVSLLELQLMFKQAPPSEKSSLLDNVSEATIEVFTSQTHKHMHHTDVVLPPQYDTEKESIWLIAPLISKLSSTVQGRVLRAAGEELKTGNNFWTAKNANEKERYLQKSISLMGHQPFLSLVLTCLKGQDEQREGLLKSLYEQLEKFVNNTKEPQDRGIPTDDRLKLMMQESLRLRMSLVGGMFDTIQRNGTLLSEWAMILIQLVSHGVVTLSNNAELFTVVLDMLSVLLHGTLVVDPVEGKDDRRTYATLVRKLKKETETKKNDSMELVRQLLPLSKVSVEVVVNETHKVKKQQGFQVSTKQKLNPWELLEGHKNPAPLSLAWFGAIKVERKPAKYEEQHRLLLYHTHSLKKPLSHYLDPPELPPEDLEPPPEQKDDMKMDPTKLMVHEGGRKMKNNKKNRKTPTGPNYNVPVVAANPNPQGVFARPGMYDGGGGGGGGSGWGGGPPMVQQGNYMSPQALPPGGPRFPGQGGPGTSKAALENMLQQKRGPGYMGPGIRQGMQGSMYMPGPSMNSQQVIRNRLIKRNPMMGGISPIGDGMYGGAPASMHGFSNMPSQGMGQTYGPAGYQQPMGMEQGMGAGAPMQGYSQGFQGSSMGMQAGNPQQAGFMGPQAGMSHPANFRSGMGAPMGSGMGGGAQMGGYSNMASGGYGGPGMQNLSQQQRLAQIRQHNMMQNMQQQQQQQPGVGSGVGVAPGVQAGGGPGGGLQTQQQQQTAALISHLQRQMSNPAVAGAPGAPQPQGTPQPQQQQQQPYGSYGQF